MTFINDLDEGIERMLSKSADDTKLKGIRREAQDSKNLNRLKHWAFSHKILFNGKKITSGKSTRLVVAGSAKVRVISVFWGLHSSHLHGC